MSGQRARTPVVLVHGAWHSDWAWENWTPVLAEHGFDVYTPRLRGVGDGSARRGVRIAEQLDDLRRFIGSLDCPPILVGHSLGGFLVQHLLSEETFPAAVLLASVPRRYPISVSTRYLAAHPLRLLRDVAAGQLLRVVGTPTLVRAAFFTDDTPDAVVARSARRVEGTALSLFWDMTVRPPKAPRPGTPVLVVAAELDPNLTPRMQRRLAAQLDADFVAVAGSGHDLPLDVAWRQCLGTVLRWMEEQGRVSCSQFLTRLE